MTVGAAIHGNGREAAANGSMPTDKQNPGDPALPARETDQGAQPSPVSESETGQPWPPARLGQADITAFVDTFAEGPFHEPVPVTSWREFQMLFGGFSATSEASYGVYLFFENGGEFAWVVRVPDPADSGLALVGAGGERQASPAAIAATLIGDPLQQTGIHALRSLGRKRPALLAIPRAAEIGPDGVTVYREALRLCQDLRMFLLVDPPLMADSPAELRAWLADNPDLASPDAALYYPRLLFPDALQHGRNRSFGPSGAVAGLYSWLDQERGIWQAPAGLHAPLDELMLGRELSAEELQPLTPLGVNPIRDLPGHGTVLWGARTLASSRTSAPEEKYVPIRRFLLALETGIRSDLRTALNSSDECVSSEATWQRAATSVAALLDQLWRQGALQGNRPQDAWFVRCDRSTMTDADIAKGELVVSVGVAPVKPAEFVALQIRVAASNDE
jgi:hypothetical protein